MNDSSITLREFVAETIKEVISGAVDAQVYAASIGASVNPSPYFHHLSASAGTMPVTTERDGVSIQNMEFDVAVTSTDETGTKGGIGVFFGAVTAGSSGKTEKGTTNMNRIKFSIPFSLPRQDEDKQRKDPEIYRVP